MLLINIEAGGHIFFLEIIYEKLPPLACSFIPWCDLNGASVQLPRDVCEPSPYRKGRKTRDYLGSEHALENLNEAAQPYTSM